jgi:hypothetical protein
MNVLTVKMCFSERQSKIYFVAFMAVAWAFRSSPLKCAYLIFFGFKEFIQLQLYKSLEGGECTPQNSFWTILAWVHISFQPLVYLMIYKHYALAEHYPVYDAYFVLLGVFAIAQLLRLRELDRFIDGPWTGPDGVQTSSVEQTCSALGEKHIAYFFNLDKPYMSQNSNPSQFAYMLFMFAPPMTTKNWRLPFALFMIGPVLVQSLYPTMSREEQGAVWCNHTVFSIPLFAMNDNLLMQSKGDTWIHNAVAASLAGWSIAKLNKNIPNTDW